MGMMRDAVRSTRGRLVIGFVACLLLWHAWQYLAAPGKVVGEFVATGVMPSFIDRLERYGFRIPNSHFLPVSMGAKRRAL